MMMVKVLYPRNGFKREGWNIKATLNELPTGEDIKKDYVELPVEWTLENTDKEEAFPDHIFSILNHRSMNPMADGKEGNMQKWLKGNELDHTSMSVGDVVKLGDKYMICINTGWKEVAK